MPQRAAINGSSQIYARSGFILRSHGAKQEIDACPAEFRLREHQQDLSTSSADSQHIVRPIHTRLLLTSSAHA